MWLVPNVDGPRMFPDATEPKCPICQQDLFGPQAHWAVAEELRGSQWLTNAIFDVANPSSQDSESMAGYDGDLSYGQDDPKPGC